MDASKAGVHTSHCCPKCGCKYGDHDCPVVLGTHKAKYECECCLSNKNDLKESLSSMSFEELSEIVKYCEARKEVTKPKLCINCRHSKPSVWGILKNWVFGWGTEWALCSRRSNGIKTLCRNERLDYSEDWVDTCGEDAKYYEVRR